MALPLVDGIVYGPVDSRRLGRSLGINLQPPTLKVCTFNCAYCQFGWTRHAMGEFPASGGSWPPPWAIASAVAARLERARAAGEVINRLTIAGHGEPTLHPAFEEIVERLCALRDQRAPQLPIAILSNSTTAGWPAVRRALLRLDERYMKLDAGSDNLLRRLNGCIRPIARIVDALHELPQIVIQAMFVTDGTGRLDNSTDAAVADWIHALLHIRPTRVQLYTLDRTPAWPYLKPVAAKRLQEIGARVAAAGLGVDVVTAGAA